MNRRLYDHKVLEVGETLSASRADDAPCRIDEIRPRLRRLQRNGEDPVFSECEPCLRRRRRKDIRRRVGSERVGRYAAELPLNVVPRVDNSDDQTGTSCRSGALLYPVFLLPWGAYGLPCSGGGELDYQGGFPGAGVFGDQTRQSPAWKRGIADVADARGIFLDFGLSGREPDSGGKPNALCAPSTGRMRRGRRAVCAVIREPVVHGGVVSCCRRVVMLTYTRSAFPDRVFSRLPGPGFLSSRQRCGPVGGAPHRLAVLFGHHTASW